MEQNYPLGKHLAIPSATPLGIEVTKAEGIYLYGPNNEKYFDLISGIAVANIGHRHPKVVAAIKEQVDKYMHVMAYGEYKQAPQTLLAEKLAQILPPQLNTTYFVNSGTEANEAAMKLAKRITGRSEILAYEKSYHGNTHGSLSVTGNENKKYAFRPLLPDIRFIKFNNLDDLRHITHRTASVIIEPIQGDAGVRIPSKKYMQSLKEKCTESGTILIADEVQTGFGRTGKFFAFEYFDIIPDVITMAKAMGGGMPLGAFSSSRENMEKLTFNPTLGHITTFGGHPVNCAAALANIDVLIEEDLISGVEEKGKLFEELLVHPRIKELRRIGLMMALEFDSEETVQKIVSQCLKQGVICFWFLSCPNSLRLSPPLIITEKETREACEIIVEVIDGI